MRLTSPLWYLVAVAIALAGSMVGTAVAASAWDGVREATIAPATEPIDAGGSTLAIFTDQPQDREITCTTRPADKPDAKGDTVSGAALDIVVEQQGTDWHLLALQPAGDDGVTISCVPSDGGTDAAAYGFAVVDGFDKANRGATIGTVSLVVGIAFGGIVFWQRRRTRLAGRE
ncbi:hypothetical protein [Aeromicrobium sp. Leaf350]|uniref:hypothetical protein n=1 Tax=Aeromicrobium sp. Leaf350 TaxID=2876565 RepID=UPI001E412398|nr:hypothetical protein [Aeromicrobium sp. Leaf350]